MRSKGRCCARWRKSAISAIPMRARSRQRSRRSWRGRPARTRARKSTVSAPCCRRERWRSQCRQKASATDSFAAMRDFIIRFPTSEHAEEAEQIANERLAFETAATLDTEESWDEYLANWSGDRHAAAARERRTAAREREEHAFEA